MNVAFSCGTSSAVSDRIVGHIVVKVFFKGWVPPPELCSRPSADGLPIAVQNGSTPSYVIAGDNYLTTITVDS